MRPSIEAPNGQSSAGLRYILQVAGSPPSTVDRHDVNGKSALKYKTMRLAIFHLKQSSNSKIERQLGKETRRVCGGFPLRTQYSRDTFWGGDAINRNISD